jgi:hypothetical protein
MDKILLKNKNTCLIRNISEQVINDLNFQLNLKEYE